MTKGRTIELKDLKFDEGLGRGSSGEVYLAHDKPTGDEFAVKILSTEYSNDPKHKERFRRETEAIGNLTHPNIVGLHGHGETPDQRLYLIMDYLKGPHLGTLSRVASPIPESVITAIGLTLASALSHAHSFGLIHRDLKPENAFITQSGLVLADFGIVKAVQDDSPLGPEAARATEIIGTPGFMAPEQLQQNELTPQTDIFALGALLYFLATREVPFPGHTVYQLVQAMRETRPLAINELRPEFSWSLANTIQACLAYDPEQRPKSMASLFYQFDRHARLIGLGDSRTLLNQFLDDPPAMRRDENQRMLNIVVTLNQRAEAAGDLLTADTMKRQLFGLDPDHPDAVPVTGVVPIASDDASPSEETYLHYRAYEKKPTWGKWWVVLGGLILGLSLPFLGVFDGAINTPEAVESAAPSVGTIRFETSGPGQLFLNGRAFGRIVPGDDIPLAPGSADIEWLDSNGTSHRYKLMVEAGSECVLKDGDIKCLAEAP